MSDLYEQKYMKYRRKYIELKSQLNGGAPQNTLTKYDSNNNGLRNFLIKYGGFNTEAKLLESIKNVLTAEAEPTTAEAAITQLKKNAPADETKKAELLESIKNVLTANTTIKEELLKRIKNVLAAAAKPTKAEAEITQLNNAVEVVEILKNEELLVILENAKKVLEKVENLQKLENFEFLAYKGFKLHKDVGMFASKQVHKGNISFFEDYSPNVNKDGRVFGKVYYNLSVIEGETSEIKLKGFPELKQSATGPEGFATFFTQGVKNKNSYFYIKDTEEAVIKALNNLKY